MSDAGVKQRGDQQRTSADIGGVAKGPSPYPLARTIAGEGMKKNEREKRAERRRECW